MSRYRSAIVNSGLVLGGLLAALLLAEAGLRLFAPDETRIRGEKIDLPYFTRYEFDAPTATKLDRRITHSRNALGFRGPNPPRDFDDHLTMVAIGGSTTECFYITDTRTWPELVGQRLQAQAPKMWVNNAGLSGHSTFGHLTLVREHLAPLAPKVLLFLVGINDRARAEPSNFDGAIDHDGNLISVLRKAVFGNSELLSLLLSLHGSWNATELGLESKEIDYGDLRQLRSSEAEVAQEVSRHRAVYVPSYAERLETLIALSRDAGTLPVLITQPVVFGEGSDPTTGVDLEGMEAYGTSGTVAWRVLELYNETTRSVARRAGVPLIDLARLLPKDTAFFYDLIHFSNLGASRVADIIAEELCPILKENFPEQVVGRCEKNINSVMRMH